MWELPLKMNFRIYSSESWKDFRDEFPTQGDDSPIDRRNGGCAAVVGDKVYIWGGQTEDIIEGEREKQDLPRSFDDLHPFDVFHISTRTWTRQQTHNQSSGNDTINTVPSLGLGSSLVYDLDRHYLYLYGGWNRRRFSSDLYALSLDNFQWKIISPKPNVRPSNRYNTELIIHENRLCMFGGVSSDILKNGQKHDPGGEWINAAPDRAYGWNNEYYEFDLDTDCWYCPLQQEANRPPPLAGHRLTKFDDKRAVLFGGKTVTGLTNDVWILDLERRDWSGPYNKSMPDEPWPRPARFFTLTPLLSPDKLKNNPQLNQKLVMLWGKALYPPNTQDKDEECNRETWIMEVVGDGIKWTEIKVEEKARAWHVAISYHPLSSFTECEIVVFGGNKHYKGQTGARLAVSDTCILKFGVKSLQSLCLNKAANLSSQEIVNAPPVFRTKIQDYTTAIQQNIPVAKILQLN